MGNMDGKIVLVTGAAGAIGKPMCVELARRGATVVMAGRKERMQAAAAEVKAASGSAKVETLELDLASLASVRVAAQEFQQRFSKLHVLINNAAVFSADRHTTADGFEQIFGVNHLGHFLLTNLLLGTLKASAPSRIVLMTMGSNVPIAFDDLMAEKKYNALNALQMSKGAITCFGVELAKRMEGTGVVVNAVNPELTKSTLPREAPLPLRLVFALFGASPERSKDYGVRVACDPEFEKITGRFFRKEVEKPIPPIYTDAGVRQRLWTESAKRVGLG
jgi:NAD(P)-dependent dehydrogenase (short-subunit alcohol dehydrogenase family)